jgi:hypothetical protein
VDASWCMRRSKDLESGAPDKIQTGDLSLRSAASLQQRETHNIDANDSPSNNTLRRVDQFADGLR